LICVKIKKDDSDGGLRQNLGSPNVPTDGSSKTRRAAQFPERPSSLQQFHIKGAICEPLHRGPISRPHPPREPVLISVPLELLAEPDLMAKPSLQTLNH
jgi:hypothetical protein